MKEVTVERGMVLLSRVRVQVKTAGLVFPAGSTWADDVAWCFEAPKVTPSWPARLLAEVDEVIGHNVSRDRVLGVELAETLSEFVLDWERVQKETQEARAGAPAVAANPEPRLRSLIEETVGVRTVLVEIAKRWRGHAGVNWDTTATVDIARLIGDAVWEAKDGQGPMDRLMMVGVFGILDERLAAEGGPLHAGSVLAVLMMLRDAFREVDPWVAEHMTFRRTETAVAL